MKKATSFGWLVVLGPLTVIVVVSLIHGLPWVADQSERGAVAEATNYTTFGRAMMREGRYKEAELQFHAAIKVKPDYAESYMSLGILYHLTNDDNRAVTYLKKAIRLSPTKKEIIYNNLGLVYFDGGQYVQALAEFQKAVQLGIRSAKIWRNIGSTQVKLQNFPAAVEAYRRVIENMPTLENLYLEMLKEEVEAENNETYVADVQAALTRGVSADDLKVYDNVIVEDNLSRDPKLADDYANLARAFEACELPDSAIVYYRHAVAIQPNNPMLQAHLGTLLSAKGEIYDAEEAFRAALTVDPRNDEARQGMEAIRERFGRRD